MREREGAGQWGSLTIQEFYPQMTQMGTFTNPPKALDHLLFGCLDRFAVVQRKHIFVNLRHLCIVLVSSEFTRAPGKWTSAGKDYPWVALTACVGPFFF